MAELKVKVVVSRGAVERSREEAYPAEDFEQANRAIPFAGEMLGDVILDVLHAAAVLPKQPAGGGEDKGVR